MNIPKSLTLEVETNGIAPYIVNDSLQKAVEIAIHLRRPLLLRGDPGAGKTQFAEVLAYQLYKDSGIDYNTKFFKWFVKSTSKAVDGLYTFDYLKRLQDANTKDVGLKKDAEYVKFGQMGQAFRNSKPDAPTILLIDEIDKADIDFPNDLLLELDQMKFVIPEVKDGSRIDQERIITIDKNNKTNYEVKAEDRPIVIITSNDERELPNAFLRRCVFYYIKFPDEVLLTDIISRHMRSSKFPKIDKDQLSSIVKEFRRIYTLMKDNPNTEKVPSTSELIDWTKIIYKDYEEGNLKLVDSKIPFTVTDKENNVRINYSEVLFKTKNDYDLIHATQNASK